MGKDQNHRLDLKVSELERDLRRREFEIAMLKEASEAVIRERNLDKVLQLIAERARALLAAETMLVPVLDHACKEYTYRAGSGTNAEEIVGESLPIDFGICGWVWRNQRSWWHGVLEELNDEERTRWEQEAGTVILVPLKGKEHLLGGLAGIDKIDGGDFDRQDLELLTLFASQAAIAIENAMAFEEAHEARVKSEAYQQELRALNADLVDINQDLEHMALYDHLTGLPNRNLIQERIRQYIYPAKRNNHSMAVLVVDLDQFKDVNDTLGHDVGDALLKQVGNRFREVVRDTDTVGRLGGDEFAIVIPIAGIDTAERVAENIINALEKPFELDNNHYFIGSSIGISICPQHGEDVSTLLKRADVAMYIAKQDNSGYFVYDAVQDKHSPGRLALTGDLRKACQKREFELHYQPKLALDGGRIVGVEALARWTHHQHGIIQPDVFIPILEQTGLIRVFTNWVLEESIKQCAIWRQQGHDISVSVNLSVHNLRDPHLSEQIAQLLMMYELPQNALVLEVTETMAMGDPRHLPKILDHLSSNGVEFSIDDFGTGYSSLSYLKRLPVSELKIDRSFVMDMDQDLDNAAIVRSTIELAHSLGLRVVAEGVENEVIMQNLQELGADQAQGYYFSRPLQPTNLPDQFQSIQDKVRSLH